MYFLLDGKKLNKFVMFGKNIIRGPVVWGAEIVKDYPEFDKKFLMPYSEIEQVAKTHKEFSVVENHVPMEDKTGKMLKIKNEIGTIKDLRADEDCKCGRGMAYLKINKLNDFIINMLLRGGVIGISGGGFAEKIGPGGHLNGENYDGVQLGIKMHHMALVTAGIPRCPTNVCGFNIGDSFLDANSLNACVSRKIPIFKKEHPDWVQARIVVDSFGYCRKKLGIKEDFDLSSDTTPETFIEYYEYLIYEGLIEKEPCVHAFYNHFKNYWNLLETSGYIYKETNNSSTKFNKNKAIKMTEAELLKEIENLKIENKKLKAAKLTDANETITKLNEANTKLVADNKKIIESFEAAKKIVIEFRTGEMEQIKSTLFDLEVNGNKVWSPDELNKLNYQQLKDEFERAKKYNPNLQTQEPTIDPNQQLFLNNQAQVYNQPSQFSALPVPKAPNPNNPTQPQLYDTSGNIIKPAAGSGGRVYSIQPPGSVPTPDEILDKNNPRWKDENGLVDDPRGML